VAGPGHGGEEKRKRVKEKRKKITFQEYIPSKSSVITYIYVFSLFLIFSEFFYKNADDF
jgi:quinol-cytochrome oxidoreductase complex cytochrome b subunit